MGDKLSAERACKDPNPIIDGRKANVNLAILGAKPRGNLAQGQLFIYFQCVCSISFHTLLAGCANVGLDVGMIRFAL